MKYSGIVLIALVLLAGVSLGGCKRAAPAPEPTRLEQLERALRFGDADERRAALDELYAFGEEAIPAVKPLLGSPDPEHRRRAVWVLSNAGSTASKDLASLARFDKDAGVRYDAVLALGASWNQPQEVIPVLRNALNDEDKWVRIAAIETLRVVGDPSVLKELEERTRDDEALVRSAAASALETLRVE